MLLTVQSAVFVIMSHEEQNMVISQKINPCKTIVDIGLPHFANKNLGCPSEIRISDKQ
jgi:hypothetical protein